MATDPTDPTAKRRILTGDTPTGRLHLGHFVGSLENRIRLRDEYACCFLPASMRAFTTRAEKGGSAGAFAANPRSRANGPEWRWSGG